jgi:hypothetical protein
MESEDFIIACPCCQAKITVDHGTGAILTHEGPPSGPAKTFEQALSEEKKRRGDAENKFTQAFREHENREEILDKKFKEAFKKAEKDDKPPPRPFDFD